MENEVMEYNIQKCDNAQLKRAKEIITKLLSSESRGLHCKANISIYEYYNSYIIDYIEYLFKKNRIIFVKDDSNKEWVEYILEIEK